MNLLYLIPSLYNPGGMERILTEKVNYLANNGNYTISIITTEQMGKPINFKLDLKINQIHLDLDFNQFFQLNLFSKYYHTKLLLKKYKVYLSQYIKENEIDICISLGGKELEFFSKLNVSCKKVCEIHFSKNIRKQFLLSRGAHLIYQWIGRYRTWQLESQTKNLDKLIVLTKADEKVWNQTHDNVMQIYNFSTFETNECADNNQKRIIAVGRLDAQKGFDLLIEAWKLAVNQCSDWKLHIFGEGEWHDKLQNSIQSYQLEKTVFLEGKSKDISKEFMNSSIFVLSSRYEGFPMVLLEALSFGVPIVSFNCITGPAEIIENDDCGILVDDGDILKLSEGITFLCNSDETRTKMAMMAKTKASKFSKVLIMQQWMDLFKNLAN